MIDLLGKYSVDEIVIFLVLIAFAIREIIVFYDWAHDRFKKSVNKEEETETLKAQLDNMSNSLAQSINELKTTIQENRELNEKMQKTIDLLVESDKDDIKAWITEKHHYFVYEKGYIDNYNLECIEKRYKHYVDEGGNSFVEDLMVEIRALPKVSK